jgi:hypothetical protein
VQAELQHMQGLAAASCRSEQLRIQVFSPRTVEWRWVHAQQNGVNDSGQFLSQLHAKLLHGLIQQLVFLAPRHLEVTPTSKIKKTSANGSTKIN